MSFFGHLKTMLRVLNNTNQSTTDGQALPINATETAPAADHRDALLLVHHLDMDGNELQTPDMIAGTIGEEVHLPAVSVTGYHLTHIEGLTRWFTQPKAQVILTYERQAGQPVWAYTYDLDRRELIGHPTMTRGPLGTAYTVTAPTIPGFKLLRSVGDLTGQYTTTSKTILFFYRNENWRQTDLTSGYVQISAETPVYPYPGATATNYLTKLQQHSTYKSFMRVQLNDETTWYSIGDEQWIPATHLQVTRGLYQEPQLGYRTQDRRGIQQTGTVSFVPGKQVHTYLQPYGHYRTTVKHGQQVKLIERLTDDNGVVWYLLEGLGYLPGRYLSHLTALDAPRDRF